MSKTLVIKLSGKLLTPEYMTPLSLHLSDLTARTGIRVCLIHGGGSTLDHWLSAWGFETQKTQGVRYTPEEQLPVVIGALAGFCNAQLVGNLLSKQLPAVGLTLADAFSFSTILSEKWEAYGKVAEIEGNDASLLTLLMDNKNIPVLSSISYHGKSGWFNVNADQAALTLATLLNADELWLLSDVDGVLDANGKVIPEIVVNDTSVSLPKSVTGGMHIKLLSAVEVAKTSHCAVTIANGTCKNALHRLFSSLKQPLDHRRCGTRIYA